MEANVKTVYFCPECGSASLDLSEIIGGLSRCKACAWEGHNSQLVATPIPAELEGDERTFMEMIADLRKLLGYNAKEYGSFLVKYGFAELKQSRKGVVLNPKQMARYMSAIGRAMLLSLIEERSAMEKERHSAS